MKKFFQITLLILAVMCSLTILAFVTHYNLILLILLSFLGIVGLLLQRIFYNKFLQHFKFIYDSFDIEVPNSIKNIYAFGMELAFIFILASIGANPVTDFIEGKISPIFTYNVLFFDLALVSAFFAIIIVLLYIFYYFIKNSED